MQCPRCGYVMSPLDKDCVRCRDLSRSTSPTVPPMAPPPPGPPQRDLSMGQGRPATPYAPYQPPPMPGQYPPPLMPGQYSPPPPGAYTPPVPGAYPSPSHPTYTPPISKQGSTAHSYNGNTVARAAGVSVLGVLLILARVARVYLILDRINHSQNTVETQTYGNVNRSSLPSQSAPINQTRQGYPYPASNPGTTPSAFVSSPSPTPVPLAAQRAQDQMNQNMQRMQQMQAENQARMRQMQADNLQRMQQMQSQMRQNHFPQPPGSSMPPTGADR